MLSTNSSKGTEMTATLQAQAQQTIADAVLRHTYSLIEALKDNYRQYAIRGHQKFVNDADNQEYHQRKIDELKSGRCDIDYVVETGKKYHKLIMVNNGFSRSVHAFVDKQNGGVFKSASWRSPVKGERYNLLLIKDREWLFENASWCGGYLYKRFV
jgi:hypothetical protein